MKQTSTRLFVLVFFNPFQIYICTLSSRLNINIYLLRKSRLTKFTKVNKCRKHKNQCNELKTVLTFTLGISAKELFMQKYYLLSNGSFLSGDRRNSLSASIVQPIVFNGFINVVFNIQYSILQFIIVTIVIAIWQFVKI